MDRDDLDTRNTAALRRWARSLQDSGGIAPPGLLDDLAAIAEEHASEVSKAAVESTIPAPVPSQPPGSGSSSVVDPGRIVGAGSPGTATAKIAGAATAPRARTRTRGGAK